MEKQVSLTEDEATKCRYILPMIGNKKIDNSGVFSDEQINGIRKTVANLNNVYCYYNCANPTLQHLYLCNLLEKYELVSFDNTVLKCVQETSGENFRYYYTPCSALDVYDCLKLMFKNKKKRALENDNLQFNMSSIQAYDDENLQDRTWWSLNSNVPFLRSSYHFNEFLTNKVLQTKHFYPNLGTNVNTGTYSVIHQFFNNTDLILYNYSHRILQESDSNDQPILHEATRIRLRLEANCSTSFFVIFNSSLVHSGAETMFCTPTEYNESHNPRLFSYISRDGSEHNQKKNNVNTIDKTSFRFCNPLSCKKCQKTRSKLKITNEVVLNAYDEYIMLRSLKENPELKKNIRAKSHASRYLVFGDLKSMGWAVYRGIPLYSNKDRDTLFIHNNLHQIISKSSSPRFWSKIENGRKLFKIVSSETIDSNMKVHDSLVGDIISLHDKLENRIRKEISGFQNCKLYDSAIIINDGICGIQQPHRDIGGDEISRDSINVDSNKKNETRKRARSSSRVPYKPDRLTFT